MWPTRRAGRHGEDQKPELKVISRMAELLHRAGTEARNASQDGQSLACVKGPCLPDTLSPPEILTLSTSMTTGSAASHADSVQLLLSRMPLVCSYSVLYVQHSPGSLTGRS
jgi:hypothetical protein